MGSSCLCLASTRNVRELPAFSARAPFHYFPSDKVSFLSGTIFAAHICWNSLAEAHKKLITGSAPCSPWQGRLLEEGGGKMRLSPAHFGAASETLLQKCTCAEPRGAAAPANFLSLSFRVQSRALSSSVIKYYL